MTGSETTTVLTKDLWDALDALDAEPETQQTEWYKRLEEAADTATQALMTASLLLQNQQMTTSLSGVGLRST